MSHLEQEPSLGVDAIPGGLRLTLPCSLEAVDAAALAAEAFLAEHAGEAALFGALLVLREALVNAVRHGCKLDPGSTVEARITLDNRQAVLVVSDPGPGHDWRGRLHCLPDTGSTSGRGMCIMDHYARSMHYNETGNILTLRVDLEKGTPS